MKQSHSFFSLTVIFATLLMTVAGIGAAQEVQKANASDLIDSARRAVAVVVKAAKNDASLSSDIAKAKPFWDGMKDLNENLSKAETGLTLKDKTFFESLASASAGFAQAEIGIIMTGGSNKPLGEAMSTLSGILDTLNENYSKESARLKQGGELTDTEKQQLDKLIAQQDKLLSKLDEVEKKVGSNNAEIKKGIENIRANAKKIKSSSHTAAGFAGGFFAAHIMYDMLWGWHWWALPRPHRRRSRR